MSMAQIGPGIVARLRSDYYSEKKSLESYGSISESYAIYVWLFRVFLFLTCTTGILPIPLCGDQNRGGRMIGNYYAVSTIELAVLCLRADARVKCYATGPDDWMMGFVVASSLIPNTSDSQTNTSRLAPYLGKSASSGDFKFLREVLPIWTTELKPAPPHPEESHVGREGFEVTYSLFSSAMIHSHPPPTKPSTLPLPPSPSVVILTYPWDDPALDSDPLTPTVSAPTRRSR